MFERIRSPRRFDARRVREFVGLLSLLYVAALVVLVAVGPFLLSAVAGVPFGRALQRVVVVAAAAYLVGMGLLLR
jgi:hypothetical protein